MSAPSDNRDLTAGLQSLAAARVVVVGDAMLDRFVYGQVERISPEGPIPILRIARDAAMPGGAGNVARNLAALGVGASLLAVIGDDAAGRELHALTAAEEGVESNLLVEPGRPTSIKERYIAGGQQLLRADRESLDDLAAATAAALMAAAETALQTAGALVLSDYGKGVLQPDRLRALIDAAQAAGKPVVVDPKGGDYAVYRGASLITPNRRELGEASGRPVESEAEIEAACRALIADCGLGAVLATRSQEGMTLVADGQPAQRLAAEAREVFDVSGAGDTVAAVVAAGLAAGMALADAARLANVAAGVVVGKVGTAAATPDELRSALHAAAFMAAETKVVGREALLASVRRWRDGGLTVGFTNGCFDLLHPGHVHLLRQARAACDRLVVGLNSDASVGRLKGPGRPVQSEAARATVLASLGDVDRVAIFDEDTPLALIEAIEPDVLVKGADYTVEQVVGADAVQRHGGRVLLAELAPGHSTSATIRKLGG